MRFSLLCLSYGVAAESNWAKCVGRYPGNETALHGYRVLVFFGREVLSILLCYTQSEVTILHVIKVVRGLRGARLLGLGQRTPSEPCGHVISTQPSQYHPSLPHYVQPTSRGQVDFLGVFHFKFVPLFMDPNTL